MPKKNSKDTVPKGEKCYRCGGKKVQLALRDEKLVPVCKIH